MMMPKALSKASVCCLICGAMVFALAKPSWAVIIRYGDALRNTTAPMDDPGWANVGRRGAGSAVYLTNRWVLTAAHVEPGAANFGGTDYEMVPGSWRRLHQPGDSSKNVDLGLFRIAETPPGVADVTISESAPTNGSEVVGIGFGRNREATETAWDSDWQPVTPPGYYRGFNLADNKTKRWGKNLVSGTGVVSNSWGDTLTVDTIFDEFGGAGDDEMQAVGGDSGGALFYKRGSDWELAGTMIALSFAYEDQPKGIVVYGNKTRAADLSQYRDQIMGVVLVPEPSTLVLLLGVGLACLIWQVRRRASRLAGP